MRKATSYPGQIREHSSTAKSSKLLLKRITQHIPRCTWLN